MADSTTHTISSMKLSDGTAFNVTALTYCGLNASGNFEISSPDGAKLNLVSKDNIQVKPNDKIQLATENYTDTTKQDEFKISVIKDKKTKVEGLKMEVAGLKFETAAACVADGWDPSVFKILYKKESGENDTWTNVNMHAASFDIRTRTTGAGTGGGIAAQIASCDSSCHENKFKIETSRKLPPCSGLPETEAQWSNYYVGEGGKGIEIGTINSQFESFYTSDLRRGYDTAVWAVNRSPVVKSATGKYDFQTQNDDSKDFKSSAQSSVTWLDLINAALYLKKNDLIPNDGSMFGCYKITTNFTNVSASNYEFAIAKNAGGTAAAADYSVTVAPVSGYTLDVASVKYKIGTGADVSVGSGNITIPAANITGNVVITASATAAS